MSTQRTCSPAEERTYGGGPTRDSRSGKEGNDTRKRTKKEADNKRIHGAVGNCHKSKSGFEAPAQRVCRDYVERGSCSREMCRFVHNSPLRSSATVFVDTSAIDQPIGAGNPPEANGAPQVPGPLAPDADEEDDTLSEISEKLPEIPELDIVKVRIPSQRRTPNLGAHSLFLRTCFFFASHLLLCLAMWIFDNADLTIGNTPFMLVFAYLGQLRYLSYFDSIIFLLWLPVCNEYRHLRECVIRWDFSSLEYGFNCDTIGAITGVLGVFMMAPGAIEFKCMCALFVAASYTLYDAVQFSGLSQASCVLHGELQACIYDRYDTMSWSYIAGSTSYYESQISQQLNVILINEFATSSARVKGTSDRMLYAALEHAKKFHHEDGRVKHQIVVNTVKYATQELIATQQSMITDGGLAARPLVLPIR